MTARGSITMEGPTRTGTWWCKVKELRISVKYGGVVSTKTERFFVWPDCADELVHVADGKLRALPIDLHS
jgi:hypothetical protein